LKPRKRGLGALAGGDCLTVVDGGSGRLSMAYPKSPKVNNKRPTTVIKTPSSSNSKTIQYMLSDG